MRRCQIARILVVEDSITVAKFAEMVLSAGGHEITLAMNGDEAMLRLNSCLFDLIILDVVMPGKNGYQLCREIKSNARLKDIPVIMMTTKGLDADKFWGMRQGADEYLVKPCTEDELLRAANKLIKSCSPIDISTGALPQTKAGAASEKPAENAAQEPADKPKIKSLKDKMQESFYRFND